MTQEYRLRCACGHEDDVPDDPAQSIYTCTECGIRTAYGAEMPRFTNAPAEDKRFLEVHLQHSALDVKILIDRAYAAQVAFDILSVCDPAKYKALMLMIQSLTTSPNEPASDALAKLG